jgi:hypothetical protein
MRSAGAGEPVPRWPGRPGLADARARGRQVVKESPYRQLSACGTLASYRVAPTSAVGLGLPLPGKRGVNAAPTGLWGWRFRTAQDAQIRTAPGRRAPRRRPRRTGVRAAPKARADYER